MLQNVKTSKLLGVLDAYLLQGNTAHPRGAGTPPLADRDMSWSFAGPNGTIQFPDQKPYVRTAFFLFARSALGNIDRA
jgi:hypothetical protein